MHLPDLTTADWLLLALAAALIGIAKTALNGVASVSVVIFAAVLPARESTGALLPLLLCGDVVAVTVYRRHADWTLLWRLLPSVLPGLALGAWFVAVADNAVMRTSIGLILLAMVALQWWNRGRVAAPGASHRGLAIPAAVSAGFATMTANAAGPITTLYFLWTGLPVMGMVGTSAWFYLVVNLAKVPFSAGLHLISAQSLTMNAVLVPALLIGAAFGTWVIHRIDRRRFELAALVLSALSAVLLLV